MQKLIIEGGNKLYGDLNISSAKNACLPIISACVLIDGIVTVKACPIIKDVVVMAEIIRDLGGDYKFANGDLRIDCRNLNKFEGDSNIFKRVRASFFTAGSILSRFGRAIIPLPGGCDLGLRPVDIHLDVFRQLGAECIVDNKRVFLNGENIKSGKVRLRYPSVGATVNAINASVCLNGETIIENCAKEPEIIDLCNFLNLCGFDIIGAGTQVIIVRGISLDKIKNRVLYRPILDRIEAGTFMIGVCACGGEIRFGYDDVKPLNRLCEILKSSGAFIEYSNENVYVKSVGRLQKMNVIADVYPEFSTDLQPQICALACICEGESDIFDNVFRERFKYVEQLSLMGAKIRQNGSGVNVCGVRNLYGADVTACDLRSGAALAIAALSAKGKTVISNSEVIDRGYENFEIKLSKLGAKITSIKD